MVRFRYGKVDGRSNDLADNRFDVVANRNGVVNSSGKFLFQHGRNAEPCGVEGSASIVDLENKVEDMVLEIEAKTLAFDLAVA